MGFDIKDIFKGKNLRRAGAVGLALPTGGLSLAMLPKGDMKKARPWALPLAAAALGGAVGGPVGLAMGAGLGAQTESGIAQRETVAKAGEKQRTLQRREVSRLARMAYENRFMGGGRSILSTRRTGKATVGA